MNATLNGGMDVRNVGQYEFGLEHRRGKGNGEQGFLFTGCAAYARPSGTKGRVIMVRRTCCDVYYPVSMLGN